MIYNKCYEKMTLKKLCFLFILYMHSFHLLSVDISFILLLNHYPSFAFLFNFVFVELYDINKGI